MIELIEGFFPFLAAGTASLNSVAGTGWNNSAGNLTMRMDYARGANPGCGQNGLATGGGYDARRGIFALPNTSSTFKSCGAAVCNNGWDDTSSNYGNVAVGLTTAAGLRLLFGFLKGTNTIFVGTMTAGGGGTGTVLYTSPAMPQGLGVYAAYCEIAWNTVTGFAEFFMNGASVWSGNIGGASSPLTEFHFTAFRGPGVATNPWMTGRSYFTDIYVDDAGTVYGDCAANYRVPNGNLSPQDWAVVGAGSAWQAIDNVPQNPAEYIESNTIGNISHFSLVAPAPVIYQVHSVGVITCAERTSASVETYGQRIGDGVWTASGSPKTPATGNTSYGRFYWQNNPNTLAPWTPAEYSGLQIGIEKVS